MRIPRAPAAASLSASRCLILSLIPSCISSPESSPTANQCNIRPSRAFVTAVVQDMASRPPSEVELGLAERADFSPEAFVDQALSTSLYDDAVTKFLSNLFRLPSLTPRGDEDPELTRDLQDEPITLVLRNKTRPWRHFFETREIFCTSRTAPLYGNPASDVVGFTSCKLPPERSGFLGLVSVLRSTSTPENPQAFYRPNNNYHRVAAALYFATGVKLAAATNGPKGEGKILPLADCVPTSDMRKTEEGLIFGTAAISLEGPACSGCHSRHLAPLSVAFRRFGPNGELLTDASLTNALDLAGAGARLPDLQALLAEDKSCWAARDKAPPTSFRGLAGLGDVIAADADLGTALGRQLPQHLANVNASAKLTARIKAEFETGGETLAAAMRGFFTSEHYTCE